MADKIDYEAYARDAAEVASTGGENILAQITRTARDLREAQDDVKLAEEKLKAAQERERILRENTLPELMKEAGQEKLRTSDGYDIELTETLRASIPAATKAEAFAWLEDHGQSAIIKRQIDLAFGRDEGEKADRALAIILEAGFTPTDKQSVHPQTLAAAIRELVERGVDVPMALLGVYVQSGVKMKIHQ